VSIELKDVKKVHPGGVEALRGISLAVEPGQIFGLLGPNGAGKTSLVRILATLSPWDGGTVRVAGLDLTTHAREVRRRIGYVAQTTALDLLATGRENLLFAGRLFGLTGSSLHRRMAELVDAFELCEVLDRRVLTYSGGMKRRLDLATGLLHTPRVLFLDEPTVGLDPQSRHLLWDRISSLVSGNGMTVLLTTHYMDEADALAGRLAIIDRGRVVAQGTPAELKRRLRGDVVTIEFPSAEGVGRAKALLEEVDGVTGVMADTTFLVAQVNDGSTAIPHLVEALRVHHLPPERLSLKQPTLDEVFLSATGRQYQPGAPRVQSFWH
jgi:ABC-2 type transport system ATP-binding protein